MAIYQAVAEAGGVVVGWAIVGVGAGFDWPGIQPAQVGSGAAEILDFVATSSVLGATACVPIEQRAEAGPVPYANQPSGLLGRLEA